MRTSLVVLALTVSCASSAPNVATTTTAAEQPAAAPPSTGSSSESSTAARVTPGSPYKGAAAGENNQSYRGNVREWLRDNEPKRRPGEKIDGAECVGNSMQHTAWCQDQKTMIICEDNTFQEVDCSKVVPSGVCALHQMGGGTLDCVTP